MSLIAFIDILIWKMLELPHFYILLGLLPFFLAFIDILICKKTVLNCTYRYTYLENVGLTSPLFFVRVTSPLSFIAFMDILYIHFKGISPFS